MGDRQGAPQLSKAHRIVAVEHDAPCVPDPRLTGIPGVRVYNFEDEEKVARILSTAVDKGFEGIDYDKLDKAFQKWVENLR